MVYQKGWDFYVDPIVDEMKGSIHVTKITNARNPRLFSPEYLLQALRMMLELVRCRPDIVHVQYFFPFLGYFLLLGRWKIVITLHEVRPRNLKGGSYGSVGAVLLWNAIFLAPFLIRKAKRLIVLTQTMKLNNRADVIPMGATNFSEVETPSQERTILFFGNMWWSKGLDILLRSVLSSDMRDIRLVVAGAGTMPDGWPELIRRCAEKFDVDLRNRRIGDDEMHSLFAESSIVALPYRSVSTSSVLTTAFAYGKPVVASAVGSFLDEVQDGKTGFLVREGRFAEAIRPILDDPRLRIQMEHNIREYMARRSWSSIAKAHVLTYQKAMAA